MTTIGSEWSLNGQSGTAIALPSPVNTLWSGDTTREQVRNEEERGETKELNSAFKPYFGHLELGVGGLNVAVLLVESINVPRQQAW